MEIKQQFLELLISIGFVPGEFSGRKQRYKDNVAEMSGNSNLLDLQLKCYFIYFLTSRLRNECQWRQ